jgi:D-aminopeptidase
MPQHAPLLVQRSELNPEHLDPLYLAAVEAVEESVVNALVAGEDVPTVKPQGLVCRAIDTDRLRALFAAP